MYESFNNEFGKAKKWKRTNIEPPPFKVRKKEQLLNEHPDVSPIICNG